jgi:ribosomal protein S18 acetylase RimI-like enzyme
MQPKVRIAKTEDLKQIELLLKQLGYELTDEQIQDRLNVYNNDFQRCFVATIDNKVVGLVAFSIRELFVIQTRKAFIEALVVEGSYRGNKIGEKLLQCAESIVKKYGCSIVELTSGKRREKDGTLRFYQKLGYSDGQKNYLRKII